MNSKSWTGTAVWREEGEPFPIRKPAGPALLLLNDEGGLLRAGPTFPETLRVDIRFGWEEVEKIERMRYLGIPLLGEAVRFTALESVPLMPKPPKGWTPTRAPVMLRLK